MPAITVVIPAYNAAAYLAETLRSLAAQTTIDFEVIVVDDRSADDTHALAGQLIQDLGLKGKVYVRPASEPKGVASCRNLAVKYAAGDWISFLDSDDIFYPGKIAHVSGMISGNPGCKAFHHGSRRFLDETGETLGISERVVPAGEPADILPVLIEKNFITTSSVTISKALFAELGGFNTALHGVEDYMLWLLVSKKTKWVCSNEVLTDYRVRQASLMSGREMSHYVMQYNKLLLVAKETGEFSQKEFNDINEHLFGELMHYYAAQSLSNKGWGDFLKGLAALIAAKRSMLARKLLYKYTRFTLLTLVQRIIKH